MQNPPVLLNIIPATLSVSQCLREKGIVTLGRGVGEWEEEEIVLTWTYSESCFMSDVTRTSVRPSKGTVTRLQHDNEIQYRPAPV